MCELNRLSRRKVCLMLALCGTSVVESFHQSSLPFVSRPYREPFLSTARNGEQYRPTSSTTERREALSADRYSFSSNLRANNRNRPLPIQDPAMVEFTSTKFYSSAESSELMTRISPKDPYPVAAMMQCSAPYIATHHGEIAVFHIPGDLLEKPGVDALLSDIALSRLLGMKIVIVIGSRYDLDVCDFDQFQNSHECHNALKITDKAAMRRVEEDAGYMRTEVERKLNRYLRVHAGSSESDGYVVSGNYYTGKRFGVIHNEDFQNTGYSSDVHADSILKVLKNNDIVLLTTVGLSRHGDLVNVNGHHLAASVAGALRAHKLIYMANEGSILQKKDCRTLIQELPVSFCRSLMEYHQVKVFNTGFAAFEHARNNLEPSSVELLIHLVSRRNDFLLPNLGLKRSSCMS